MLSQGNRENVPSTTSPGRNRALALRSRLTPFGFMAPAGGLVILFFFIPMVLIIYLSITNLATMNFTTNILKMHVVGAENFERIMNDQFAPKIFFNTLFYVLATLSLFNVGLALLISLLSTHVARRAGFIFRALWLLPRITPSVIYILIWKRMMADPPFGILNQFNNWLGQPSVAYYQDHPWVFVVIVNGFVGASFGMIIFTSAIESIPKDLLNASLVDGSSMTQRIRYIILPLMRWPLLFVITYQTLSLLTSFEYILLLTKGGVSAVLVPRHVNGTGVVMPSLVADPDELDRADPLAPAYPLNAARLAARLTRGEPGGMLAAVLRPCEIRAFVELVKLNQGSMDGILLVSADCPGAYTNDGWRTFVSGRDPMAATADFLGAALAGEAAPGGVELARACRACEHPATDVADIAIGLYGTDTSKALLGVFNTPKAEGVLSRLGLSEGGDAEARRKALAEVVTAREAFRDAMFGETAEATSSLPKLADYLSACVNCYNCRVACPVCYCKECVFVTDVFDHKPWQYMGWAKARGALRMPPDTVFYHLTRLAHMSTLCVGCGQCSNACPNGVPVMELFRMTAARTQPAFEYEAGRNPDEKPPMSIFREKEFAEMTGGRD